MEKYGYRFSFGPWNIHEGADPFGPPVRPSRGLRRKAGILKDLGFDAMQFHDDDAVPDLDDLSPAEIAQQARAMRQLLEDHGLVAEFVAPRLWEHPMTDRRRRITANDPAARAYAIERSKKAADIGRELGCNLMVLWLAREGTYLREAKDAVRATHRLLEAVNTLLAYDPDAAHRHRAQAQRTDGPGLHPHHRPRPGAGHAGQRPGPRRRAGGVGPRHPGRPGPGRRDELRPGLRQAVERAPQRPERPQVRPGPLVWLGRPAPGLQPGARAGREPLLARRAWSAWTSRPCAPSRPSWPPST